ncbi:MAG: chloride channel protein, partial [Magnetococcales bacterium]|nr:chloride channel protein [Magnetococcales bacterium]
PEEPERVPPPQGQEQEPQQAAWPSREPADLPPERAHYASPPQAPWQGAESMQSD